MSILDGIQTFGKKVEFSKTGCHRKMKASKAVVVVGEQPYAENYGDSDNLDLPQKQKTSSTGVKPSASR